MYTAQSNAYFENSINTASPSRLLILLCDGAVRHCRQGIEAIKKNDYEKANTHLCKAQDIVQEFIVTLDKNSDIAASLLPLYDFILRQLRDANIKKNVDLAAEALDLLKELKETWVQAERQLKQQTSPANSPVGQVSQYG